MSETDNATPIPVFDSNLPYDMKDTKDGKRHFIQCDAVFDHNFVYQYSLSTEFAPGTQEQYHAVMLDEPVPWTAEELAEQETHAVFCPLCGFKSYTRYYVSKHCDKKHHKHLVQIERELRAKQCNSV